MTRRSIEARPRSPLAVRAVLAVVLVASNIAPALIVSRLGFADAVSPFVLSAAAALVAALLVGGRFGLAVAGVLAAGHVVAALVAGMPLLAGLVMGAIAALYGLTARRGLTSSLVMGPISIAFAIAEPAVLVRDAPIANAFAAGAAALAGGLWGTGAGALIGRRIPRPPLSPASWFQARTFAIAIALAAGTSMGVVVAMDLRHGGAWLLLTIFMIVQPDPARTRMKTAHRVLGTVLGFVLALAVGLALSAGPATIAIGLLLMVASVMVKLNPARPYWLYAAILTAAIVLTEGSSGSIVGTDVARLSFTLIGAAVAVAILGAVHLLRLDARDGDTP